jgi:hypothetical protein
MPNFTGKSGGGPHHMKNGYGTGKNPITLTPGGKKAIMASDANPEFKKAIANSPIDMYGKKGSMATFKSDGQRKAAYASGYKGKGK